MINGKCADGFQQLVEQFRGGLGRLGASRRASAVKAEYNSFRSLPYLVKPVGEQHHEIARHELGFARFVRRFFKEAECGLAVAALVGKRLDAVSSPSGATPTASTSGRWRKTNDAGLAIGNQVKCGREHWRMSRVLLRMLLKSESSLRKKYPGLRASGCNFPLASARIMAVTSSRRGHRARSRRR